MTSIRFKCPDCALELPAGALERDEFARHRVERHGVAPADVRPGNHAYSTGGGQ